MSYEIKISRLKSNPSQRSESIDRRGQLSPTRPSAQSTQVTVRPLPSRARVGWLLKGLVVMVTATFLSTLVLRATDDPELWRSVWALTAGSQATERCPEGMAYIDGSSSLCVDRFPASADSNCPYPDPEHSGHSTVNLSTAGCQAVSKPNRQPWRYLARHQAETACALAGKRLPTALEWHRSAIGTPFYSNRSSASVCHLEGRDPRSGSVDSDCRSAGGAVDMAGNVWEWVLEDVVAGNWNGRSLPETGYVRAVDQAGVAVETGDQPLAEYGGDFVWTDEIEVRGMARGGYWGSSIRGGIYSVNTTMSPSFAGQGVGFRCVSSPNF